MTDITDPETRSRMMRGIRGKNTKPEIAIRHALHSRGFRYRLHVNDMAGKPDIVLPKWNAVIFIHGCFWHHHEGCNNAGIPATRREFWLNKLKENQTRDKRHIEQLLKCGWKVAVVWECSIRHMLKTHDTAVIEGLSTWLKNGCSSSLEL
jgi:DNA mismatch endonuclease (patch repair protein)